MAYAEAEQRMPAGDQYAIKGFDRGLVKLAVNTVFNARTRNSGVLAITEELYTEDALREASGLTPRSRSACRHLAERVVTAIEHRHRRIADHFNSDCGAGFQRRDSDMAIQVMLAMTKRTGRCPLPMHDSFLVADLDAAVLASTMSEVATRHGLRLTLKDSQGRRWSTTPFHMGVKNRDCGGNGPYLGRLEAVLSIHNDLNDDTWGSVHGVWQFRPSHSRGPPEIRQHRHKAPTHTRLGIAQVLAGGVVRLGR